ncbi:hypothetical protein DM860_011047 [Cuscuta australis]|uniref:Uncharacterized protein n=1 Tax=Cuscuta australis TaxID=267555 RepID=A0A328E0N0_9ASTE|nr:hypothetical protein DM860_011047 [Cuscuta australis]
MVTQHFCNRPFRVPSQPEMTAGFRENSSGLRVGGLLDEKMDMLWEDFNDDLRQGNRGVGGLESRRLPDVVPPPDTAVRAFNNGGEVGSHLFSTFLVMKLLKKLLVFKKSAAAFRRHHHASFP